MRYILPITVIFLSACANIPKNSDDDVILSDEDAIIELARFTQQRQRLTKVHNQVMIANAELCEHTHLNLGVLMHQLSDYPLRFRQKVEDNAVAASFPTVVYVDDINSSNPLRPGDIILDKDDKPTHPYVRDVQNYMHAGFIRIKRDGESLILPVNPSKSCSYRPSLKADKRINATALNGDIQVTTAMMDIVGSDDELSFIIGHELAHYTQKHVQIISANNKDNVRIHDGRKASKSQEIEADYAGLYYAARGGYDYNKVNAFWGRIKNASLFSFLSFLSSYPDIEKRKKFLDEVGEGIDDKKRRGEPLIP